MQISDEAYQLLFHMDKVVLRGEHFIGYHRNEDLLSDIVISLGVYVWTALAATSLTNT